MRQPIQADTPAHEPLADAGLDLVVPYRLGFAVVTVTAIWFALAHEAAWRVGALLLLDAGLVLVGLVFAHRLREVGRRSPVLLAWIVLGTVGCTIFLTGFWASPIQVVLVPHALIAALSMPPRRLALVVPAPMLILAIDGLVYALCPRTPPWLPASLAVEVGPSTFAFAVAILAGAVVGALTVGARQSHQRRALTRSVLASRERTIRNLEDRQRDMQAFTAALAHELKGPLTAVQGLATALERRPDHDQRTRAGLAVLVQQTHRLRDTVQNLLDVYRPLEPGRSRPVELVDVIAEVVALHEALALQEGVELDVHTPTSVVVHGDRRKLAAVVVALVQNAIEASPAEGSVELSLEECGEGAVLYIRDEGPGLPDHVVAQLFTAGVTTKDAGNGLGLFTARFLVDQHQGDLRVRNRSEGGCEARVQWPREEGGHANAAGGR